MPSLESATPARFTGLSEAQAATRLGLDGPNELPDQQKRTLSRALGER